MSLRRKGGKCPNIQVITVSWICSGPCGSATSNSDGFRAGYLFSDNHPPLKPRLVVNALSMPAGMKALGGMGKFSATWVFIGQSVLRTTWIV